MEGYKDEGWSSNVGLQDDLEQLEAQISEQFGDEEDQWGRHFQSLD